MICRALLIDMDGVLVDSTPAVARTWAAWAAKHGMDAGYVVKYAHGRTSLNSIRELLPNATNETHLTENQWLEDAEVADFADVTALPGTHELLRAIQPAQFAVVTSASRKLAEVRLRAAGLWQFAKNLVTSSDIQRGKPDPEPYLKGAAKLAIPADHCIVIEDAPSGTRSGKSAGARVLALRTTTPDDELRVAGADWIINDCSSIQVLASSSSAELHLELLSETTIRIPKMS